MIVKVLEPLYKTVSSNNEEGEKVYEDVIYKFTIKKMELVEITEYAEIINEKTKKPYKKRCVLRAADQWLIVNHSFDELCEMKNLNNNGVVIKGFYGKTSRSRSRYNNKGSKRK